MSSTGINIFHAVIRTEQREGVYQLRIYSAHKNWVVDHGRVQLYAHWNPIKILQKEPIVLDERVLVSVGEQTVESEDELFQGSPRYDQLRIKLRAVPELLPLVALMRDPDYDIWVEVMLEQHVLDAPEITVDSGYLAPRKKRNYFWGKLDRKEGEGAIKKQLFIEGPDTEIRRYAVEHDGTLDLSFMHWLKASSELAVKSFLDYFLESYPLNGTREAIRVSRLLQALLEWLSPTDQVAVRDWRLLSEDDVGDKGADRLWVTFNAAPGGGVAFELQGWWIPVRLGAFRPALFENVDNKPGEHSLYAMKDLAELLFRLCDEFFLFPQVEIPCFEDLDGYQYQGTNSSAWRKKFWKATTRWFIINYETSNIPIHVSPLVDTIRYRPAATWASSYHVEQPNADGVLPAPAYTTLYSAFQGGAAKSYKTLFRFVGYVIKKIGTSEVQSPSPRGYELCYGPNPDTQFITSVLAGGGNNTVIIVDDWAKFHAMVRINRWGSVKSTLEFTSRGIGIEPFGEYATFKGKPADKPKFTFGLRDFGEFPLLRVLNARYGLIPDDDKTLIKYLLLSIARTPSGNAKLKFIELTELEDPDPDLFVDAPPAKLPETDPPTVDTPNVTPGETLPSVKTVQVSAADTDSGIAQVKLFFNLSTAPPTLVDTLTVPGVDGYYTFTIKSTLYANGNYTLTATAVDGAGNTASSVKSVVISTPP